MAIDRNKLTAEAAGYLEKGNYKKAIATYETLVRSFPDDERLLLRLADTQARGGQKAAAVRTYNELADHFVVEGFFLKAISVYKQLLRLVPDDLGARASLGNLYFQMGIPSDALACYNEVAQAHLAREDMRAYVETLQRMLDIDPSNVGIRIKLAEQLARQGADASAAFHLREALRALDEAGRFEEYVRVAERYLQIEPDDHASVCRLVEVLLLVDKPRRALGRIQTVFRAGAYDGAAIDLLARTLVAAEGGERAVPVLREIANLAHADGRADESRQAWQRILALDPSHPEARSALREPADDHDLERVSDEDEDEGGAEMTFEVVSHDEPDVDHGPAIEKILNETDIYLKYNLHQKALDHLAQALALDPSAPGALDRRRGVWLELDDKRAAALDTAALAKRLRNAEPERAATLAAEARALAGDDPDVLALLLAPAAPGRDAAAANLARHEALTPVPAAVAVASPGDSQLPVFEFVEDADPLAPPVDAEESQRTSLDDFDALFAGVDAEQPEPAPRALDEEVSLIRAIDSVFDHAGLSQGIPGTGVQFSDFDGADVPEELALLLDDVDAQAAEGNAGLAHSTLLELMSEFPEHAEIILARMDRLAGVRADESRLGLPADSQLPVFELLDDEDEDHEQSDDDGDDADDEIVDVDMIDDEDEAAPFDDEDDDDEMLLDVLSDEEEEEEEAEHGDDDEELLGVLTDEETLDDDPATAEPDGGASALASPDDDATPLPEVMPDAMRDALAVSSMGFPSAAFGSRDDGDLRVPVLSGDFPVVAGDEDDDRHEPTDTTLRHLAYADPDQTAGVQGPAVTFDDDTAAGSSSQAALRSSGNVASASALRPGPEPQRSLSAFAPEPSLDHHFDVMDEEEAPSDALSASSAIPAAVAPPEAPAVEAPVGRPSPAARPNFVPLETALENEPAGTLGQAVQILDAGGAMEAVAMLQPEFYGEHAVAAVFLSAVANLQLGMFLEALTYFESLENAPGVSPDDVRTLRYFQGLCCEALAQTERARAHFGTVMADDPDLRFPDAPHRHARLA